MISGVTSSCKNVICNYCPLLSSSSVLKRMYSNVSTKPLNQRWPTGQALPRLQGSHQRLRPLLCHCSITNSPLLMAATELPEIMYPSSEKISNNLKVSLMEANKNVSSHKNFISSPLGIEMLLSMVAAGSTRETKEQLLNFLGSKNLETINMKASKIMEIISPAIDKTKSEGSTVSFVNGAWVDHLHSIRPSFSKLLKDMYHAEAKAVDFQKKEEVCEQVNSWASQSTQGLINEILSPEHLGKDSMLILANALFFKAAWEYPFTSTENKKFHLLSGETIKAPFMTHEKFHKLKGASFDGFKLVRIPYQSAQDGREFAMYMFLPNDKNGLVGLMERFSEDSSFLDQEFELEQGVLSEFWIPKFKFSHGFSALDALKRLGLDRIFMNVGELTEIVNDNSSKLLFLSDILQKSYISVDEQGTEAASVTMGLFYGSARLKIPREKFSFIADHPFMFLIREEISKVNFFIGTVLNPILG